MTEILLTEIQEYISTNYTKGVIPAFKKVQAPNFDCAEKMHFTDCLAKLSVDDYDDFINRLAVASDPYLIEYFKSIVGDNSPVMRNLLEKSKRSGEKTPASINVMDSLKQAIDLRYFPQLTFYVKMCKYLDRSGYATDADFYNSIGISRQVFSRIKDPKRLGTVPSKNTAIAIAVGLKLSYEEAEELISLAGYSFQKNRLRDVILMFFFQNRIYDMQKIDETLNYFNEEILFSCV